MPTWLAGAEGPRASIAPTPPAVRHGCAVGAVVLVLVSGCADWFEKDTCGGPGLRVTIAPAKSCLALGGSAGNRGGTYFIDGTNGCTDPLVVTTQDGGAMTFAPGAAVSIELFDGAPAGDAAPGTWTLTATLGAETLTITANRTPC
jgi:hypothetical protein